MQDTKVHVPKIDTYFINENDEEARLKLQRNVEKKKKPQKDNLGGNNIILKIAKVV